VRRDGAQAADRDVVGDRKRQREPFAFPVFDEVAERGVGDDLAAGDLLQTEERAYEIGASGADEPREAEDLRSAQVECGGAEAGRAGEVVDTENRVARLRGFEVAW